MVLLGQIMAADMQYKSNTYKDQKKLKNKHQQIQHTFFTILLPIARHKLVPK